MAVRTMSGLWKRTSTALRKLRNESGGSAPKRKRTTQPNPETEAHSDGGPQEHDQREPGYGRCKVHQGSGECGDRARREQTERTDSHEQLAAQEGRPFHPGTLPHSERSGTNRRECPENARELVSSAVIGWFPPIERADYAAAVAVLTLALGIGVDPRSSLSPTTRCLPRWRTPMETTL